MSQSATPAMQKETRDETRGRRKTSISCETSSIFDTFDRLSNRLECRKVPRLPCKRTWQPPWKPLKRRFCSFPHRHGEATGKPETRDETRGRRKTMISCETSSMFDAFDTVSNRLECRKVPRLPCKRTWQPPWKPLKRRFCSFPHRLGEATGKPETRDETRGNTSEIC